VLADTLTQTKRESLPLVEFKSNDKAIVKRTKKSKEHKD